MPCYRCATRQTDPGKGPSAWKRGVVGGVQVLICPDCQRSHDWESDLDSCGECGSTRLIRALGETRCRQCGAVATGGGGLPPADESLAADVSAALDKRFGSYPDSTVP
jgi:hypothetical protein